MSSYNKHHDIASNVSALLPSYKGFVFSSNVRTHWSGNLNFLSLSLKANAVPVLFVHKLLKKTKNSGLIDYPGIHMIVWNDVSYVTHVAKRQKAVMWTSYTETTNTETLHKRNNG